MAKNTGAVTVEYIQHMGDDEMIAKAARVSTGADKETQEKIKGLIGYLAREDHTSPFEHTALTVRVEAPIFVAREAMRHRTFSYNELSARYAEMDHEAYIPKSDRPLRNAGSAAHPKLEVPGTEDTDLYTYAVVTQHYKAYDAAFEAYREMLDAGVATEVARSVLPVGTYTSWYMTGNLLNWFRFLELRDGRKGHPQVEITWLAEEVWKIIQKLWPVACEAWLNKVK